MMSHIDAFTDYRVFSDLSLSFHAGVPLASTLDAPAVLSKTFCMRVVWTILAACFMYHIVLFCALVP